VTRLFDEVVEPLFNKTVTALEESEPIDDHRIVLPSKYDSTNFPALLSDYLSYLEIFYIGAKNRSGKRRKAAYPPEIWSKFNAVLAGRYRTSNSAENWHRQVQSSLNKLGSIYKFIDWISQEDILKKEERRRNAAKVNPDVPVDPLEGGARKSWWRARTEKIRNIVKQFGVLDDLEFLESIAELLKDK
jgi:hypothetical protein